MKQTSGPAKKPGEAVIKDIRRATRRQFSSEEKIRVVLEGLRGEDSIELAVRFTDERRYFVSESTVYRLLKAQDLITSPAYSVIKAADEFRDKTTAPNQLWQTDFTYLKVVGWGWYYLSTVLDEPKDRVATSHAISWLGSCAPRCRPTSRPLTATSDAAKGSWPSGNASSARP